MPILLPKLDYGPAYRALEFKGASQRAGLLKESWDIASEFRDLQRRERRSQDTFGMLQGLVQLGESVYKIASQAKMEKAKGLLQAEQQRIQQETRDAIFNGQYELTTDEEGNRSLRLKGNYEKNYQQAASGLDQQFKGFPEVRQWAKDQLYELYDAGKQQALSYALSKEIQDRNNAFEQNLASAMNAAVSSGSFAPLQAVFEGTPWLSPAEKEARRKAAEREFTYRISEREVRAITASQGYDKGLAAVEQVQQSRALSTEQVQALRNAAASADKEAAAANLQQAETAYAQRLEAGQAPGNFREELLAAFPEARRQEVREKLLAKQERWAHEKTTERFNESRDNLQQLRSLYEATKKDPLGWYGGIEEQQRLDLEMLQREIEASERALGGEAKDEAWADRQIALIWQSFTRGDINAAAARKQMDDMGIITSHPAQYTSMVDRLAGYVAPQCKRFVEELHDITQSALMKAMGVSKEAKLTTEQRLQVEGAAAWLHGLVMDRIGENPKISPLELQEYIQPALAAFYAKEHEVLRQPILERAAASSDRQLAKLQKQIEEQGWGSLVFEDIKGVRQVNPAARANLEMLWAREQAMLQEQLGEVVSMRLAPEGWDVGPLAIFKDAKGRVYRFFSDNGKKLVPHVLEGQQWKPLGKPAAAQVAQAAPPPLSKEQLQELISEKGAASLLPALKPPEASVRIRAGMTPEEARAAARQLRGF